MPLEVHALTTITRKGSGIGQEASLAFAAAGAAYVVLLGRTEATLKETASRVASATPAVTTSVRVCDLTKEETLRDAAAAIGTWQILIIASGYAAQPSSILSADMGDWWQAFEVCPVLLLEHSTIRMHHLTDSVDQCQGHAASSPSIHPHGRPPARGSPRLDHGCHPHAGGVSGWAIGVRQLQAGQDQGLRIPGCREPRDIHRHGPSRLRSYRYFQHHGC